MRVVGILGRVRARINSHWGDIVMDKRMNAIAQPTSLIRKPYGARPLEDNEQWKNRFEIKSQTSNRLYVIAQNKQTQKWGCSCPAYRTRRYCKHLLKGCALPTSQIHGHGQIAAPKKRSSLGD